MGLWGRPDPSTTLSSMGTHFYTDQPPVSSPPKHHMDPQNNMENEAKMFLSHAKTLRLHTGNIVNRSRLKKKCPCSPSEELQDCIQAALSDWKAATKPPSNGENQSLAHLQPAWEELESLVRSQRIAAIGTSDLDKDLLEQLYTWAQVKPSSNQVNLASCCLMSAATFQEAVQEGTQDLSAAIWRLEWVLRYSIIVKSRGIIKAKGYLVSAGKGSQ
ncbi:hypothetical protein F7725_027278 [Dissostichus mawsoni]|uniref:GCS light chain n=1 Tax=Dissostichus mawsoni TaxID=36200 RepID=A0A7J5XCI7_DISMA|nr:hypothetical protein F7725_027278 [Dissostichus mawsoni]